MLECPNDPCFNKEAKRLIACDIVKKVVCDKCHPDHAKSKSNFGVVVHTDGISETKKREIENRMISHDGKVINRTSGKPARL